MPRSSNEPLLFPPPLELQAALAGALGQGLHAAVVHIAAAVEHDGLDAPEPYKGKGIKYADEVIRRKEGKTGVKKK